MGDITKESLSLEGIRLELYHGEQESAIFLKDAYGMLGSKYYTKRIHKYESESDFKRLSTELRTYGYQHGLLPEWERLQQVRSYPI